VSYQQPLPRLLVRSDGDSVNTVLTPHSFLPKSQRAWGEEDLQAHISSEFPVPNTLSLLPALQAISGGTNYELTNKELRANNAMSPGQDNSDNNRNSTEAVSNIPLRPNLANPPRQVPNIPQRRPVANRPSEVQQIPPSPALLHRPNEVQNLPPVPNRPVPKVPKKAHNVPPVPNRAVPKVTQRPANVANP